MMKVGVLLMTYGSPKTLSQVPQYLRNVYGGKNPNPEVIQEFKRRYELIGGSHLIQITQSQAQALEKKLNFQKNHQFKVTAGMRFSEPFIKDVVKKISPNTDLLVGIIMSPQYSPIIMKGYINEIEEAVNSLPNPKPKLKVATDWHLEPHFLDALTQRVKQALLKIPANLRDQTPILFSAHSMPKKVIENEPNYIKDLRETATEVARRLNLPKNSWMFCYQSAGHTPEEWLKPDFADLMPELKEEGYKSVLIAPVQFLADHLEILYDIDIAARLQAEENGIKFYRTRSLNTSKLFINALAQIVNGQVRQME